VDYCILCFHSVGTRICVVRVLLYSVSQICCCSCSRNCFVNIINGRDKVVKCIWMRRTAICILL
jgi:hypothetical protein